MLDLSEYPRFSLAERDRRWQNVRRLMKRAGCDCIVAPGLRDPEEQATSRYLSQIGGTVNAWVVFPIEGQVTAIVESRRNFDFMARAQDWIGDLRIGAASELVPEVIRERGLEGGRIGLTQFQGHYRAPEGNIPHYMVERMKTELPHAGLYPENGVIQEARLIKGPEEVAVIERIAAANEQAIDVMCATARPGVRQQEVWYAMSNVMTRATGSWPARLSVTFSAAANVTLGMPIPDVIAPGVLCSQEICARFQGYRAQCNHTIQVGDDGPLDYREAMLQTINVYNEMVHWLRPGKTVRALCDRYLELCEAANAKDASGVFLHTNGLGNDYPRIGPGAKQGEIGDIVFEPGMTFTLKPVLGFPSGTRTQFGDPLTITESGARRIGKRLQEPIVVA